MTTKRFVKFDPDLDADIRMQLLLMVQDTTYNTGSTYSADGERYPDNLIPFVDKHMNYLYSHPTMDPVQYLGNLRLMTRVH
jgi:hypothetical protein